MENKNYFKKIKKEISKILILGFIVGVAWYSSEHYYQLMMISGDSMSPSFYSGQIVVLDKYSNHYEYEDVIAFRCDNLESVLVKRIVACPNDIIVIKEGTLYVNGTVSEAFSKETKFEYAGIAKNVIYLEENQYFVIGDNVKESKDSRYLEIGCICEEDIIGKVLE